MSLSSTHLVFMGAYSRAEGSSEIGGLTAAHLHRDGTDPQIDVLTQWNEIENPSFLQVVRREASGAFVLLVVAEHHTDGRCALVRFDPSQHRFCRLSELVSTRGGDPCHVLVLPDLHAAVICNYTFGGPVLLRYSADDPVQFTGPAESLPFDFPEAPTLGPNKERQEQPHAHCALRHPRAPYLFVSDLGRDAVFVYSLPDFRLRPELTVRMAAGCGPRHLAYLDATDTLLVSCELNSTVTPVKCAFDGPVPVFTVLAACSTLPAPIPAGRRNQVAHIDTDQRYVFVANRGHDSLAVFRATDRADAPVEPVVHRVVPAWPRHFARVPYTHALLVGGQHASTVRYYRLDRGLPCEVPSVNLHVPHVACIVFAEPA